jgi:hypothetical protein
VRTFVWAFSAIFLIGLFDIGGYVAYDRLNLVF